MESIKFDEQIPFVLNKELLEEINEFIKAKKETYNSRSHFIRCAVIEKMRG